MKKRTIKPQHRYYADRLSAYLNGTLDFFTPDTAVGAGVIVMAGGKPACTLKSVHAGGRCPVTRFVPSMERDCSPDAAFSDGDAVAMTRNGRVIVNADYPGSVRIGTAIGDWPKGCGRVRFVFNPDSRPVSEAR